MASRQLKVIQSGTLRRQLEEQIAGEVRFDAVSRALYSTDASVYQIHPLGWCSRNRVTISFAPSTSRAPMASRLPPAAAARRRRAGDRRRLQLDTSKYYNRILELNVPERWAIVEPGIVLDELNAQLKPHGLRFAPDISTASRATDRRHGQQQLVRRQGPSVREDDRPRARARRGVVRRISRCHMRPLKSAELEAACQGDTLEARCYRTVRQVARDCAAEIDKRYPKVRAPRERLQPRRIRRPRRSRSTSRKIIVGLRGDAGDDRRRQRSTWCRCRSRKRSSPSSSTSCSMRSRDARDPAPQAVGDRDSWTGSS
jgi:hypothetical protein